MNWENILNCYNILREVIMGADKYYNHDELKKDRKILLEAVKRNGLVLEHASDELKGDWETVLAVIEDHWASVYFASDEIKNDREMI